MPLLLAAWAAPACVTSSARPSPGVPDLNGRAAADAAGEERSPEAPSARPSPKEAFDRWGDFFDERFGREPEGALGGDFDGDGEREAATVLGGDLFIFDGLTEPAPKHWTVVLPGPQANAPRVESSAWARAAMPRHAQEIGGAAVLVVGEEAPLVVFYAQRRGEYARAQVIPKRYQRLLRRAEARVPGAFDFGPNNLAGPGAEGDRGKLRAAFLGDFDKSGDLELAVLDVPSRNIYIWESVAAEPTVSALDYPAARALLHQSDRHTLTPFRADAEPNSKPEEVEIEGDFLKLWIPGTSSIYLTRQDGVWKTDWLSD